MIDTHFPIGAFVIIVIYVVFMEWVDAILKKSGKEWYSEAKETIFKVGVTTLVFCVISLIWFSEGLV